MKSPPSSPADRHPAAVSGGAGPGAGDGARRGKAVPAPKALARPKPAPSGTPGGQSPGSGPVPGPAGARPRPPVRNWALLVLGPAVALALVALAFPVTWHSAAFFWLHPRAQERLPVPLPGVRPQRIADTWDGPRPGGRRHQGTDIFAPRGTPIYAATPAVVLRVGENRLGGKVVWLLAPGMERHYYAHLDAFAPGLAVGQEIAAGTLVGRVGTTGNARGTPPHLHFGIYRAGGAVNPWPRLTAPHWPTEVTAD